MQAGREQQQNTINPNSYGQVPMYPGSTGEGMVNLCLGGLGKASQNWSCRTTKSVCQAGNEGRESGVDTPGTENSPGQWFSTGANFAPSPRRYLATSGNIFSYHLGREQCSCHGVGESRGGDPMNSHPPASSSHRIFQVRILEQAAVSYSRGSSQPRDRTCVFCSSCAGRQILYHCTT